MAYKEQKIYIILSDEILREESVKRDTTQYRKVILGNIHPFVNEVVEILVQHRQILRVLRVYFVIYNQCLID